MESGEWRQAAEESDLAEGRLLEVAVGDRQVLLVRTGGRIHACAAECPHYKGHLARGSLSGHILTCPSHNARFDLRDGRLLSPPALGDLAVHEVKVERGKVWVRLRDAPRIEMPGGTDDRTFLIVGGGAAGAAAAETLRREGYSGRIVLLTQEPVGPYDRPTLSKDYLSGEATAKWLPLRGEKFYDRLKIELATGSRVTSLDPRSRTLTLADGSTMRGERILLATGSVALRPPVPGIDLPGCYTLRSLADADALLAALPSSGTVAVLGASFIGLEAASSLRKRGLEVQVVAPEELPLAKVFGAEIGRRMKAEAEKAGVRFHLGTTAYSVKGNGRARYLVLSDGTQLEADAVLIGVGVRPAVEYLAGSGLAEAGAVPVNARQATAAEGVFAAGDIALFKEASGGLPRRIEHWTEAERQGRHAARAMLGRSPLPREVPFFWTRQHGKSLKYVGHAPVWDRLVFRGNPAEESFLAGYYVGNFLRAVASLGKDRDQDLIRLGEALEAGRAVSPERFSDPDFDPLELSTGPGQPAGPA
jgi:NADPH-dependent 2,4-dienoyl-CoA reductase/sulfur reductase-like enzyme/nitrite reductase/ring-hydroxylating ferredoxin subunit